MSKIFFVIVTFNSENYIRKCLDSIKLYEPNTSIVVVDNVSIDRTIEILSTYDNLQILRNKKNIGFGKANNLGIKLAIDNGADYIYLLNHDAFLCQSITSSLIDDFNNFDSYGVLTPLQININERELETNFERFLYYQGVLSTFLGDMLFKGSVEGIYEVNFFQAASWFIKVDVLKKVGLFNPIFFHYGEDNEFLNRLHYHGFKSGINPNIKIVHEGNPLNMSYKRNYKKYHRNRIFNTWLIEMLDINKNLDMFKIIFSCNFLIKSMLKSIVTFRFLRFLRQIILLYSIVSKMFLIKTIRKKSINNTIIC